MTAARTLWGKPAALVVTFAIFVMAWVPLSAEKAPDLGKAKVKDLAKYLALTPEQQAKIKTDVDRIHALVKDAQKQSAASGMAVGGRAPVGGSGVFGRPGTGSTAREVPSAAKLEERRAQRKEWQTEINNRVERIKSVLSPEQLEKFKNVQVPDLFAPPVR